MNVRFPDGWALAPLARSHDRSQFDCGDHTVNDWLRTKARQSQDKNLTASNVLLDGQGAIAGFYTLAFSQVSLDALPRDVAAGLPQKPVPVIVLAWFGVDLKAQRLGLGERLLAQVLVHCHEVSKLIPFVAVMLDCLTDRAKSFFQRFDFKECPGQPMKLLLTKNLLEELTGKDS